MELKKKMFNIFLYVSMVRTWDALVRGDLGPWDLHLNKLNKTLLGNATYNFQASEPNGSEEVLFLCISMVRT